MSQRLGGREGPPHPQLRECTCYQSRSLGCVCEWEGTVMLPWVLGSQHWSLLDPGLAPRSLHPSALVWEG